MSRVLRRHTVLLSSLGLLAAVCTGPPAAARVPADLSSAEPAGQVQQGTGFRWRAVDVDTRRHLFSVSAVSAEVAWVAGERASVFRTTDGGDSWEDVSPTAARRLQFRDIEALDEDTAVGLTIGPGHFSQIYRTNDAGQTWRRSFLNRDPRAFYDCLDFWPGGRRGLAVSDPVGGKFRVLATRDGGRHWRRTPRTGMPKALPEEYGVAASGACLRTVGKRHAWFATWDGAARVFHSGNGGRTWHVSRTGIKTPPSEGLFALAFQGPMRGVAVGGDGTGRLPRVQSTAVTRDGRHWTTRGETTSTRYSVEWLPDSRRSVVVAVGPRGSDVSFDAARTWARFSLKPYGGLSCAPADGTCWATGGRGEVGILVR